LPSLEKLLAYAMACVETATYDVSEDMWCPEMDQLNAILRDCHLHEEEVCGVTSGFVPVGTSAFVPVPVPACLLPPPTAPLAAAVGVTPWADELVRQLQSCASAEHGRAICAEALLAFHKHQAGTCCGDVSTSPHLVRLQKLQGANKVIVRALRMMSERQSATQARCRQAEEANLHLAEQLRQCQEQLAASERAKANLQSHLQLMNSNLSEQAFNRHGPCS